MRNPEWENERHARRMKLMRMQGEINRSQRRADFWLIAAVVLGVIAIFGAMVF